MWILDWLVIWALVSMFCWETKRAYILKYVYVIKILKDIYMHIRYLCWQVWLHDRQHHPADHRDTASATNQWADQQVSPFGQLWTDGGNSHCINTSRAVQCCPGRYSSWCVITVDWCSKDIMQTQQRPKSPIVTLSLTWHGSKYKVHLVEFMCLVFVDLWISESDGVYVHACQVRVTVGDSGHCCCVSAICDVLWVLINPFGPRPAAALLLRNPMWREVTVSSDPGIGL